MDETALIRAAQGGDLSAFNELVATYQGRVYNLAYRLLGEAGEAADATQDAFIAAFTRIGSYREGNFGGWLLRITANLCYDELRRHKRHPVTSLDTPQSEAHFVSAVEGPEQAALRAELNRAIQGCLDALPEDQRLAAVLCDIQGYDYQEIAQVTAAALGTVKSRIARARSKLRDCLLAYQELFPEQFRSNL